MTSPAIKDAPQTPTRRRTDLVYWLNRNWLLVVTLVLGLFVGLPWLAPVFMALGWTGAAEAIYFIYSSQCHQMPQRSFFLFGDQPMLSLSTVRALWQESSDPRVLRQFVGNTEVGWKVAWSDRMVYMYGSLLLFGLLFWPLRRRLRPLSGIGLVLFLLPMALDGGSHALSDALGGIGGGFRYTNEWLAALTGHLFSATFYAGDALGSFNSWMRLLSGLFFGIGAVWFLYPRLQAGFDDNVRVQAAKMQRRQS